MDAPSPAGLPIFEEDFLRRARAYQTRRLLWGLVSSTLEFGVLLLFLLWHLRADAGSASGGAFWSGFAAFSLIAASKALVSLPSDFYGSRVLARREGLSNESAAGWLWDRCKGLALLLLFGGGASGGCLVLMAARPEDWWWMAALAGALLLAFLSLIAPVLLAPLFFRFRPLADGELRERLLGLLERTKARVRGGVWEMEMSSKSRTANAALVGWGPSRRVILSDTLLGFPHDEIEAVLAHEVAHHAGRHIAALLAMRSAALALGLYLSHEALGWPGAWGSPALARPGAPAGLVVVWVVLTCAGAAASPLLLAISRALEHRCDRWAALRAGTGGGLASALARLCERNLTDPAPPRWVVALFHSHPPVAERLARIESRERAP